MFTSNPLELQGTQAQVLKSSNRIFTLVRNANLVEYKLVSLSYGKIQGPENYLKKTFIYSSSLKLLFNNGIYKVKYLIFTIT